MNLAQGERTPSKSDRIITEHQNNFQSEYDSTKARQVIVRDQDDISEDQQSNLTGSPSTLRWRNVKRQNPAFSIITVSSNNNVFMLNDAKLKEEQLIKLKAINLNDANTTNTNPDLEEQD